MPNATDVGVSCMGLESGQGRTGRIDRQIQIRWNGNRNATFALRGVDTIGARPLAVTRQGGGIVGIENE